MNNATFGQTLRAMRLGFRSMPGVGWVRIRTGGPPTMVDVYPFGLSPVASSGGEHFCWWDEDEMVEMIEDVITAALETCPPEAPVTLTLDDDGKPIVEGA